MTSGRTSRVPLWLHRGPGHYIGSLVIVCARAKEDAESIVREQLDSCGLRSEQVSIEEVPISEGSVIVCESGDY